MFHRTFSRRLVSRLACLLAAGAVTVSLTGCGADSASGSEPAPDPLPQHPEPVVHVDPAHDPLTAYYELPEGMVRVTGVVFAADEHMHPRRPFKSGSVVAMTRERYDRFRLEARGPWKSALVNGRDFPMPGRLLEDPDVFRSDLDASGTFSLTILPGDYMVCLGNLSEVDHDAADSPDVWVEKAFEATVGDDDLQTIIPVLDRATGELALHH